MEEQKKVNPLATEKEGKLIAKFAIPCYFLTIRDCQSLLLCLMPHKNHH